MSDSPIWMPHAAHFWAGPECQFTLATYLPSGFIVSTVGELARSRVYELGVLHARLRVESDPFEALSASPAHMYETMVFRAKKSRKKCCPFEIRVSKDVYSERYSEPGPATAGHMKAIEQWRTQK